MKEEITDAEMVMIEEFARRRRDFWSDVFKYLDWEVEKKLEYDLKKNIFLYLKFPYRFRP